MLPDLKEKLLEVVKTVAPLIAVVCLLQVVWVQAPAVVFLQFLAGSVLVTVGMLLLFIGVDLGILPMGRFIGAELPKKGSVTLIVAAAFAIGFATTIAEPDVLVLVHQIDRLSHSAVHGTAVLYVIAIGVAAFVSVAMVRIVFGFSMRALLTAAFGAVILLSFVTPAEFVPLAYDAGSVTTGVLTAPVVIAVALGLSSVLAGRASLSDSFGILGLASIGPIIAIMILGMCSGE